MNSDQVCRACQEMIANSLVVKKGMHWHKQNKTYDIFSTTRSAGAKIHRLAWSATTAVLSPLSTSFTLFLISFIEIRLQSIVWVVNFILAVIVHENSIQRFWESDISLCRHRISADLNVNRGQTTGDIWVPKYYIFPINDLPHRPPSEKSEKSGKNSKQRLSNLKKNFQISFSQYANNVGTPLFRSMRQAQNTDSLALNQLGVPQNSSLLWSNFTADIWHPPWPGRDFL